MTHVIDDVRRTELFLQAKEAHDSLGVLFQNSMELTPEMVDMEIEAINAVEAKLARMRSELLMLRRKTL